MITLQDIVAEVKLAGLPCELQNGSKHIKIIVCGEFCGIWGKNENCRSGRAPINVRAQVRRCIKKHISSVDSVHRTM
jgi:hypothetical protein